MTKKIYIPIGIPAAGKTTYYQKNFDENLVLRISRDDFNDILSKGTFTSAIGKIIKNLEFAGIKEILNGGFSVYVDRTNLTPKVRKRYIKVAKETCQSVYVVALYFEPNLKDSLNRNILRADKTLTQKEGIEKWLPESLKQITMPTLDEGFNQIILLNKEGNVSKVETVREQAEEDSDTVPNQQESGN